VSAKRSLPERKLLRELVEASVSAAHSAGQVLRRHFGGRLRIREKKGAGLVTQADLEAEETALGILRKARPAFGVLAEESQPLEAGDEGRWIVDPLDGTTNFVHGFPIHHPILDETYVAALGQGSRLNGKPIRVSPRGRLSASLLTTGFTYHKRSWLKREMEAFEAVSASARAVRRPGSAALDLAYVARGVFDGFWEQRLSPWDVAAGALLVEEAGGKVTDFRGGEFRLDCRQVLATNRVIHRPLIRLLAPVRKTC
jgi:myo-inositol-1(or 4)-monophosphatase